MARLRGPGSRGAAAVVAAVLWALARPAPPPPAPDCPCPGERVAELEWTVWVGCDPHSRPRPLRGAASLLFGEPLDLNRADARALETLPGIGPGRARQIVTERSRRPFASLADVERVRGIGPGTARGLAGWVVVGPGPVRHSQKCFQLLPLPCENSYTKRAGNPARPGSGFASAGDSASGLQGGFPSCDRLAD